MKGDVVVLEASVRYTPEVPEPVEAGEERTRYRAEWRGDGLENEESNAGHDEAKANLNNIVEMHLGWFCDIYCLEQGLWPKNDLLLLHI